MSKEEYSIEASSVVVVALKATYPSRNQQPVEGIATDRLTLLHLIGQATAKLQHWQKPYPYSELPVVPHLEMAVQVETKPTFQGTALVSRS